MPRPRPVRAVLAYQTGLVQPARSKKAAWKRSLIARWADVLGSAENGVPRSRASGRPGRRGSPTLARVENPLRCERSTAQHHVSPAVDLLGRVTGSGGAGLSVEGGVAQR